MNSWSFSTQVYSGFDSLERLRSLQNEVILIVCDPFLKGSDSLNYVISLMSSSNEVHTYTEVIPDPPISHVVQGVEFAKTLHPTVMIAIGGGSAIDMSKGIAYFARKLEHLHIHTFIAIPTTSGTGSEVTAFAVLTDASTQTKYPLLDDEILPDEALLTPLFVKTSPPKVTAYSGMDVLVHALESYVADQANLFTDALAEKAIETVFDMLPLCFLPTATEEQRMAMHEASCMAGLSFNKAGLGITHAMAHQLGGQFHVPHGLANSMLLPYVMVFNATKCPHVLRKYARLSTKLGFALVSASEQDQFRALLQHVVGLAQTLECPMNLVEFGVDTKTSTDRLSVMVEKALQDMTYSTNPYKASAEDLANLYHNIL